MSRVTVLVTLDRLSLFYSLAPLVAHGNGDVRFDVTQSLQHCLSKDTNPNLLILRYFSTFPAGSDLDNRLDLSIFARLRERYERITFFDDSDGAGATRFEVLPYVDWYLKKQLLRDRSQYEQPLYGRQYFTSYYHHSHGVQDDPPLFRACLPAGPEAQKVQLAFNLAAGSYPISRRRQQIGVALARTVGVPAGLAFREAPRPVDVDLPRPKAVHAHFRVAGPPTIAHQRRIFEERVGADERFDVGPVSERAYQADLARSRGTLSPFGWGEICLRDFEAFIAGSVLFKPRMDHLSTWPDLYRPGETYVPLDWDAQDVLEKADAHLDGDDRRRLAACAQQAFFDARHQIPARVREVLELVVA